MSTQIITISEDVMNTVIKPIFLNDIEKNTIFTHNPANAKGVSNDIVEKSYLSSSTHHRKVVRISLLRMTCVTFLIKEYRSRTLSSRERQVIHVAETFTITKKSTALLVDDEKVYPPFCYKNYAEYAVMKAAQP
jgi:hypothetical protein